MTMLRQRLLLQGNLILIAKHSRSGQLIPELDSTFKQNLRLACTQVQCGDWFGHFATSEVEYDPTRVQRHW